MTHVVSLFKFRLNILNCNFYEIINCLQRNCFKNPKYITLRFHGFVTQLHSVTCVTQIVILIAVSNFKGILSTKIKSKFFYMFNRTESFALFNAANYLLIIHGL